MLRNASKIADVAKGKEAKNIKEVYQRKEKSEGKQF